MLQNKEGFVAAVVSGDIMANSFFSRSISKTASVIGCR